MQPQRYGPFEYVPIHRRPKLQWPGGARVALWVNPNIEFFGLDDVMPGTVNERVPREHARNDLDPLADGFNLETRRFAHRVCGGGGQDEQDP